MIALAQPLAGDLVVTPHGYYGAARPARNGIHRGLDFRAARGARVLSATSGRVARVGFDPPVPEGGHGGGHYVIVQSVDASGGLYELGYMHLDAPLVAPNQAVAAGDTVGAAGDSGTSSGGGVHLHFQVKQLVGASFQPVDPTHALPIVASSPHASSRSSASWAPRLALGLVGLAISRWL